ncbi:MAG TPA: hypothetical protein VIX83_00195 [Candidatus Cybelea sp.]
MPLGIAAILAGCGNQSQNGIPPTVARAALGSPANLDSAKTKQAERLFVSDPGTGDIDIFEIPSLKIFTVLQGFGQPQGECADDKGDVWITGGSSKAIYELTYSGGQKNQLDDTYGDPDGCAWNPMNGNVAVMNVFDNAGESGLVLVYHHGSGAPNTFQNLKQHYYNFGGYDSSGNLFFDGSSLNGRFMLSELSVNGASAHTVSISGGKIYQAGMVQWDSSANRLIVGDQRCGEATRSCLYYLSISGKHATIEGRIDLSSSQGGAVCDVVQGVIMGRELFASDNNTCGSARSATYSWKFPAGGAPLAQNAKFAVTPFGAAVAVSHLRTAEKNNFGGPRHDP